MRAIWYLVSHRSIKDVGLESCPNPDIWGVGGSIPLFQVPKASKRDCNCGICATTTRYVLYVRKFDSLMLGHLDIIYS